MSTATPFVSQRYLLAESPCWSQQHGGLFWVDILGQSLLFSAAGETPVEWRFEEKVTSCNGAADGRLVLTLAKRIVLFDPDSGASEHWLDVEPELPGNRCNDAGVDPDGNLWFGTMDDAEKAMSGALYCLKRGQREPDRILGEVGISNTFAWDAARNRMYFADSARREIYALEIAWVAGQPELQARQVYLRTPDGIGPDGSCLDDQGRLFNARWGAGAVVMSSPEGDEIEAVEVPANYVTSCCFGGPARDTLYITSAAPPGLEGAGALGGGVFCVKMPGHRGPVEALFAPC